MKKILFAAVTLDIGGIETALVTLLNHLAKEKENENYKYDITLVLEKKQGIFLDTLDKKIKIIEYSPSKFKVKIIRKILNFIKQIKFKNKYGNKFDFSASYATYSLPASFVARNASQNSALWCHMDYLEQFGGNKEKVKEFFEEKHYKDFDKFIFVSKKSKESFLEVFPQMKEKVLFINNLINYEDIESKSKEKVDVEKENKVTFLNLGRHEEEQKKLSRIIEASRIIKEKKLEFKVILIGDGKDTNEYKRMVKEYDLEDIIIFLGRKKNPYPYFKIVDYVILSSDYEGSPVVFTEAMILRKPIITTDVAGSEQIEGKFGTVVEKNSTEIAKAMENYICNGYVLEEKFDSKKYNSNILSEINKIM